MSTTTQVLNIQNMFDGILVGFESGMRQMSHVLWDTLLQFLSDHWVAVGGSLLLAFVFVTIKAVLGKWASFGSFSYHLLYFGILFIAGLMGGPEIFVSDFYHLFTTIILYPICYLLVGVVLERTGLKRF